MRRDFPILERRPGGKPLIYLDSAATALKPTVVTEAERWYATHSTANVHRGAHRLSTEASEAFEAARATVGAFLGIDSGRVIWTRGATEGINLVARGLGLQATDRVLVPVGEHHSNILPWMRAAQVCWFEHDAREPIDVSQIAEAIEATRPKVLTVSAASSITGAIHPVIEICLAARRLGIITVVDASQAIPHFALDPSALAAACDYLVFSGHKMLGPTGIGVLAGQVDALERLDPLMVGGGAVERVTSTGYALRPVPARFEAGTPNISGALGLAAAIAYLQKIGARHVCDHEQQIALMLSEVLDEVRGVTRLMTRATPRLALGSIAFSSEGLSTYAATALSDHHGIMARSGYHCAHLLFEQLGLTGGAVRMSAYIYNNEEDIIALGSALRQILRS